MAKKDSSAIVQSSAVEPASMALESDLFEGLPLEFKEIKLSRTWFRKFPHSRIAFLPLARSKDVRALYESRFGNADEPLYCWGCLNLVPTMFMLDGEQVAVEPGEIFYMFEDARMREVLREANLKRQGVGLRLGDKVEKYHAKLKANTYMWEMSAYIAEDKRFADAYSKYTANVLLPSSEDDADAEGAAKAEASSKTA